MGAVTSQKFYPGFLPFGSDDSSIIFQASLKSASDLGSFAVSGSGTAPTYDANKGIILNAATRRLLWSPTAAQYAAMRRGCTFTFWIEAAYIGRERQPGAVNEFCLSWTGSSTTVKINHSGSDGKLRINYDPPGAAAANLAEVAAVTNIGRDDFVRIDVSVRENNIDWYVDGLLALDGNFTEPQGSGAFGAISLGDSSASSSVYQYYIKDFIVSTRPICLPVHPTLVHVNFYGDSFTKIGQYPSGTELGIIARREDGQTNASSGTTSFDSIASIYDGGCLAVAHRELAKRNFNVGQRMYFWGDGGSAILDATGGDLTTQVDLSLTNYPSPTMAIIHIGTNDSTGTTTLANITDGTWAAAYQTEIDKLITAGCNHIGLCLLPPIAAGALSGYDTATNRAKDEAMNAAIAGIVADNSECFVIDPAWGGNDGFNIAHFGGLDGEYEDSDDRHPSMLGHSVLGRAIANAIMARL